MDRLLDKILTEPLQKFHFRFPLFLTGYPFFPVNKKIRSNVSSGMGYWAGYGSSYYKVSIADSLALGRVW